MATPPFYPGKYFFYPIGNTSAVCLTRDLGPEDPANFLLLGCGDPRNVLYTVFCEPSNTRRVLDFTCCDVDAAVLARNVLLLSMIADKQPHTTTIWNIFFHIYLDQKSLSVLVEQCRKLVQFSESIDQWMASPYGSFLSVCTEYTLTELRRHWALYIDMQDLPSERMKVIRDAFTAKSTSIGQKKGTITSSARSSGAVMMLAVQVSGDQYKKYWKTGTTFSDPKQIATASLLNPTFVYSLGGEGAFIHYGTDPLVPFHLAALFGNAKGSVSISDAVRAARAEFGDWCSAFQLSIESPSSASPPVIRFFLGEATAVCRVLRTYKETKALKSSVPVAQWMAQLLHLSEKTYGSGRAPASFNVIDTSNLDDTIGLLNILIATIPLLSALSTGVLYTESLLIRGEDATKEFAERLFADITTMGLLLGLCPLDYMAGFNPRSNTHELMMHNFLKGDTGQYHQVTTWKSPVGGDTIAFRDTVEPRSPVFNSQQLGKLLYDIYHRLFEQEDSRTFMKYHQANLFKAILSSTIIRYMRESFVMLLKLVRDRLCILPEQWLEVMDRFLDFSEADHSMPMDTVHFNDFCAQLHRHGVHTVDAYRIRVPRIGRFVGWDEVSPIVRVILTVPRNSLQPLEEQVEQIGTPPLQCDIRGNWMHNIFTAVHIAFGKVIQMGTKARPWVVLEEDKQRWEGTSPLVVSFVVPALLLTQHERAEFLHVCLSVKSTPGTALLISKLGMNLNIFSAKLLDESHVQILPEQPLPSTIPMTLSITTPTAFEPQIGTTGSTVVELDEECELVESLNTRISVEEKEAQQLLGSGTNPQILQISPCVLQVTLDRHKQNLLYPFPVIGSQHKLRLARKSLYIEVVVGVSGPFRPDGMAVNPFLVAGTQGAFKPWTVHRVNLSQLPVLDIKAPKLRQWLDPHFGSMFSSRERSLRKKNKNDEDVLMAMKDTIHTVMVRSSGTQGGPAKRVFSLFDKATKNCDTVIFVSDIRYDLASHTLLCDGYILPLTHDIMPEIEGPFGVLVRDSGMVQTSVHEGEMRAWKQLFPALVERCRSTWQHGPNCEYQVQGKIPLAETMELDPLCSCGRGKDVEGMQKLPLWRKFAPYVTRIALSPLFGVSYLETIGKDPNARKCFVCRGKGNPKLMTCTVCMKVRYCGAVCQKRDWKVHKLRCKRAN